MSKAGLAMASQIWAVRLAELGIPVYEVRPGIIDTDMASSLKSCPAAFGGYQLFRQQALAEGYQKEPVT